MFLLPCLLQREFEVRRLQEGLTESTAALKVAQAETVSLKSDLDNTRNAVRESTAETERLRAVFFPPTKMSLEVPQ